MLWVVVRLEVWIQKYFSLHILNSYPILHFFLNLQILNISEH